MAKQQDATDIDFNDPPDPNAIWRASLVAAHLDDFTTPEGQYAMVCYYAGIEYQYVPQDAVDVGGAE